MAAKLRKIKCKAIISLNDHPDIRKCFEGFGMESLSIDYTVGGGGNKDRAPGADHLQLGPGGGAGWIVLKLVALIEVSATDSINAQLLRGAVQKRLQICANTIASVQYSGSWQSMNACLAGRLFQKGRWVWAHFQETGT